MVKILYIAGFERSGSTIFHNVVGQSPNLCAVGEVRQLWHRALLGERPCGCGVDPLIGCPFWRKVLGHAYGSIENVHPKKWYKFRRWSSNRYFPLVLLPGGEGILRFWLASYRQIMHSLYSSIQSVSGVNVIVDSSKSPTHAWFVNTISGIDVYVLHITRDPRGVAYSVLKRKRQGHHDYQGYSLNRAIFEWRIINYFCEKLDTVDGVKYRRLKYESFIRNPKREVEKALEWVGENEEEASWIGGQNVRLQKTHTAGGSPHRFTTGTIELRQDSEWKSGLTAKEIDKTRRLSSNAMTKYDY